MEVRAGTMVFVIPLQKEVIIDGVFDCLDCHRPWYIVNPVETDNSMEDWECLCGRMYAKVKGAMYYRRSQLGIPEEVGECTIDQLLPR